MDIVYRPIGVVGSPFKDIAGMPIQPTGARGVRGTVDILPEYRTGLQDLAGFSHVILLYHFHRSGPCSLTVVPFLDTIPRGVFATRAPRRPNPIGLSVVRLLGVEEGRLEIMDVDILDGTPLLDIKPFVPSFDSPGDVRTGWLGDAGRAGTARSDERFK